MSLLIIWSLFDFFQSVEALYAVVEAILIATLTSGRTLAFIGDLVRTSNGLKHIQTWLDRKPAYADATEEARALTAQGSIVPPREAVIRFNNVDLRYPSRPDRLALDNLSLRLEPSKTYAFCGPSGSGKSSILALLQRFYEPTQGTMTIGGIDARALEIETLRGMMGYVSQEAVLFEGSIRFNICLGAQDPDNVSQAELEAACEQASILDFIRGLDDGFETDLGMRGGRLSGGQRQRICIARALIRKPAVLLLDEATSALDNESEAIVRRAIEQISAAPGGPTIVTVAHRLSTIRHADVINVMEYGRIVETGTHDELIKKQARYWDLVEAQM